MRGAHNKKTARRYVALVVWLILAAVAAALIIYFSGESAPESTETSKGLIRRILEFFFGESSEDKVSFYNFYIRKAAHFTLFAAFGLSLCAGLKHQDRLPAVPFTLACGALFAAADEIRQHFVPGRAPELRDVAIDFSGVLLGTLAVALISFLVQRHREKNRFIP